ncbi:SagB/ThcOx family dehydrogenase [Thalassobacillus pellis]|uniref:SagB/ThcOx family dehydrogenase n=1 Tax=Thalassobacillus pellis TaxID=748008 RepID=UPI00195FA826|nr:SagB/ThcOx family dehydrogenase [Thalassobacillus pellis]MBM7553040.1 SagB-type dehydrogenase family enzyme [Thalassobacillus pellis]
MEEIFKNYHQVSSWPPIRKPDGIHKKKKHDTAELVKLNYQKLNQELVNSLIGRKSAKAIKKGELSKDELGTFLKWSVGIGSSNRRTYPSAGGLYTNQVFIVANEVDGITEGVYSYLPDEHALQHEKGAVQIKDALVQSDIDCNFCLIIAANIGNAASHYGERSYRFCLLEAGHMVQNIMLVANALHHAVAPIGGFKDSVVNEQLLPKHKSLSAFYLVPVGFSCKWNEAME